MRYSHIVWLSLLALAGNAAQAKELAFGDAWQQLLQVSDKLQASQQEVNRAQAEKAAEIGRAHV